MQPRFARRWAWVVLPMLGVIALEALQDIALHDVLPPWAHVLVLGVVLVGGAIVVAGALFRKFDRMTAELQARTDELEARNNATAALQRVSLVVSALRDLDLVLDTVTEQTQSSIKVGNLEDFVDICANAHSPRIGERL